MKNSTLTLSVELIEVEQKICHSTSVHAYRIVQVCRNRLKIWSQMLKPLSCGNENLVPAIVQLIQFDH